MLKKIIFLAGGMLLWLPLMPNPGHSEDPIGAFQMAQMMRIPRVHNIAVQGTFEGATPFTWLEPRELRAGRGDSVVFINESQADIRIRIGGNSSCEEVPKKSLDWRLAPNRCFETKDVLGHKEALNIRFRDIGRYPYAIEFVDKNRVERGLIFIRTEDR